MTIRRCVQSLLLLTIVSLMTACGSGGGGSTGTSSVGGSNPAQSQPVAAAGSSQTILLGQPVQLDASGSVSPAGQPLTYNWYFLAKPDGSRSVLDAPTSETPRFMPDKAGLYLLSLVVNDGTTDSQESTVRVTVQAYEPEHTTAETGVGSAIGQVGETVSVPIYVHNIQGLSQLQFQIDYDSTSLEYENADFTLAPKSAGTVIQATPGSAGQLSVSYVYDQTNPADVVGFGDAILGYLDFKILTVGSHALSISSGEILDANSQPVTCSYGTRARILGYTLTNGTLTGTITYDPFAVVGTPYGFDLSGSTIPDPLNTWLHINVDGSETSVINDLEPNQITFDKAGSSTVGVTIESGGVTVPLPQQTVNVYQTAPAG